MRIEEITSDKPTVCERILRALPDWFGIEQAIVDYVRDTQEMPMFGALDGEEVVGFVSLKIHNQSTAEIYVMGILPAYHRQGIGRELVDYSEAYLLKRGFRFLTVKTLGPSRKNAEYEKTREFYEAMGFLPLEEFKTLWDESNPCLFMAKMLPT